MDIVILSGFLLNSIDNLDMWRYYSLKPSSI